MNNNMTAEDKFVEKVIDEIKKDCLDCVDMTARVFFLQKNMVGGGFTVPIEEGDNKRKVYYKVGFKLGTELGDLNVIGLINEAWSSKRTDIRPADDTNKKEVLLFTFRKLEDIKISQKFLAYEIVRVGSPTSKKKCLTPSTEFPMDTEWKTISNYADKKIDETEARSNIFDALILGYMNAIKPDTMESTKEIYKLLIEDQI